MTDDRWSSPDRDGIITCSLDVGAVSTLRGRRKRRGSRPRLEDVTRWPGPWRELLKRWLKGGARRKWASLLLTAGSRRVHDAWQIFDALLKAGLIEVEELRENGRWQPLWVEFLELEAVRERVGLTNREKIQRLRDEQAGGRLQNAALVGLLQSLEQMPLERAVRRHELLAALDRWIGGGYDGTRRDFALFARGDTKGISGAEWSWINEALPLETVGISRHTPAIWLRAPLSLTTASGSLDLRCVSDCIGITPETIDRLVSIEGGICCWHILENRTVFENIARQKGADDGVLWVPGFAPSWWKQGVIKILDLCPASALVACDPDPAGIEIALDVGRVWAEKGLDWEPWRMDAETLSSLPQRKDLKEDDYHRLNRLLVQSLPEQLQELSLWMLNNGKKGEQEGISF